ncbi:hypothetical protein MVEN_02164900 [Mycena venus]|uniref:Uncharacterized protein n=1 Tax=Mycena venus TaxID=2733690 RepID=A0A8H7CFW4_9AGAR|nr:hypothetical protein MVEN_02164900 [Mycena venus]
MKTAATLLFAASVLVTVCASPVANAANSEIVSRWAAERQAVTLREVASAAKGQGIAPAQREDIVRLESQWAAAVQQQSVSLDDFPHPQQPFTLSPLNRPSRPQTGYISVHQNNSHGPFIGFLAANKLVETRMEATKYSIAEPDRPFGESIGPAMKAFHLARHAPRGTFDDGPRWSAELNAFILTSAFSLNPESKEITVHWVNPHGDSPHTMIALTLVQQQRRVFYTGDVSAFEGVVGAGSSVELAAFNWVEIRADQY